MSNDRQRQDLQSTFIEHRGRLHDAAKRIVGRNDVAEDILQSAYIRVTENSLRAVVRQPVSYCFQVVRHLAIDCCRRRALEAQLFVGEIEGHAVCAPRLSPETSVMSGQFLRKIEDALAQLPLRTRQAFMLYRLEGLTQRVIAERLHVSPTLVNFMIKDAVTALKGCDGAAEL